MIEGSPVPPVPTWRGDVAGLVDAVQFDEEPTAAVDRLVELIVATDVFPGTPEQYLDSTRDALTSTEKLADLVPQPHSEGSLRGMLRALEQRLAGWLDRSPGFTALPADQWRPTTAASLVAHLEREPDVLSRWLRVPFEAVADNQFDVRLLPLRLSSGEPVALIQIVGNPAPGTSLFQAGARPAEQVLNEFLTDTGLPRTVVGWVGGARPGPS